jgi:hypothetical protein
MTAFNQWGANIRDIGPLVVGGGAFMLALVAALPIRFYLLVYSWTTTVYEG